MNTPALLNVIRMFFLLLAGFIGASVAMGEATNIWWFGSLVGIGFASRVIVALGTGFDGGTGGVSSLI